MVGPDGKERPLGSFHQCYRIDGKLVAIGVLDLLPDCVSAVYFLYHESIHWLNPGKLGALREIALAREAGYRWWYPGYYVHNCAKMRYKIEYKPQYVLDPEDLQWYLLDKDALERFDKSHYVCFSSKEGEEKDGEPKVQDDTSKREGDGQGTHQADSQPPPESSAVDATASVQESTTDSPTVAPTEEEDGDKVTRTKQGNADGDGDGGGGEEEEEEEAFLLLSNMPGIPSLAEMQQVDMDNMVIRSDFSDNLIIASHLVIWDTENVAQFGSLKSRIAELVAAVGPDLRQEICIDFRKRSS